MTKRLPAEVKKQRKPTRVACTFCSQKHLQCDDVRPCKNCTKRGHAASCQDAERKKKKPRPVPQRKRPAPTADKVPRPRGRPRKPKMVLEGLANASGATTEGAVVGSAATPGGPAQSLGQINPELPPTGTGLSNLNLPNLNSLPSFLNTPKAANFGQFQPVVPHSPLNLESLVQKNGVHALDSMSSFPDMKMNSSFWDIKSATAQGSKKLPGDNNNNRNNIPPGDAQLFAKANSAASAIAKNAKSSAAASQPKSSLAQIKSSTSLLNILNPSSASPPPGNKPLDSVSNVATTAIEHTTSANAAKVNSTSSSEDDEDEPNAPLEFKANASFNNKSPSRSPVRTHSRQHSLQQQQPQSQQPRPSDSLMQLTEFLSNATPESTSYKASTTPLSSTGFNVGYARQMNFEMDALNYPSSVSGSGAATFSLDDDDSRPFIEINLEDGTMISSYPNNGTPNSFVFNPNHSQMTNTANEIPNDLEQNDDYTSPLIMRHVIKHPDDIYLTSIVKAYQYPIAYHALIAYLKRRFNKLQLLEIAKCMAKYRPSFISATKSLYENDLIFTERSFQRTLLEYEHLISMSPSPTIIWRRTGEIVAMTNTFCAMTGYSKMSLLSKRTFIVELMDDESTIKYFRSFSDLAFGDLNATYLTDCNLRKATDDDYLKCCCIWTIKRDAFDIPMLIVGQFLPVLE